MQPGILPRNMSRSDCSGMAGICMVCIGVALVTTSTAEPNGSAVPGAVKRVRSRGKNSIKSARAVSAGLSRFLPSPPHRSLAARIANTPPIAATQ